MAAADIRRLIDEIAFLPTARWDELAADHVEFDELVPGRPKTEERMREEIRRDRCIAVVGGRGAGKSSLIAGVSNSMRDEGYVPLRIGVLAAEREEILDPARFAQHAVREVLAHQNDQIEDWQRKGLVEATADEVTAVHGGAEAGADIGVGVPPVDVRLAGKLRAGSRQILTDFDTSGAVEALRRLVGIVNYQDGEDGTNRQPLFIVEDTDAWLSEPGSEELADAVDEELVDAFFQRDVRMLVNEVPAASLVAVHPDYERTTGFKGVGDRIGRIEIPSFDVPRDPLAAILQHRIARAGVPVSVDQVFDGEAMAELANVYLETQASLRAVLLVAHYALEETPGAESVSAEDVKYAWRAHVP